MAISSRVLIAGLCVTALPVGFLLWTQAGTEPIPAAALPIAGDGADRHDGDPGSTGMVGQAPVLRSAQVVGTNERVQVLQEPPDVPTSIPTPVVSGRGAKYWRDFESSMAGEPLVGAELAAITTQALKLFDDHLRPKLDRLDESVDEFVAVKRILRHSDLVFDLLPELARLIHAGKVQVQRPGGASQALTPVVTFSLDQDKPELFINIHDARMNFAYRLPRSVGSEERWLAILDEWRRR